MSCKAKLTRLHSTTRGRWGGGLKWEGGTRSSAKLHCTHETGMTGFLVPNLVAKMKPSMEMKRNCENVMMLPLPGNSLQQTRSSQAEPPGNSPPPDGMPVWGTGQRHETDTTHRNAADKLFLLWSDPGRLNVENHSPIVEIDVLAVRGG